MSMKAKVIIGGPPETGKTYAANLFSDATESLGGEYHPTHGVRILEFDQDGQMPGRNETVRVSVELWDCGGSKEYESCWPAFSKDAKGIILIYDPGQSSQYKIVEQWYRYFVKQHNLKDAQCLQIAMHKPADSNQPDWAVPSALQHIQCVHANIDDNSESLKQIFSSFLMDLATVIKEDQEKDEMGIVGNKRRS